MRDYRSINQLPQELLDRISNTYPSPFDGFRVCFLQAIDLAEPGLMSESDWIIYADPVPWERLYDHAQVEDLRNLWPEPWFLHGLISRLLRVTLSPVARLLPDAVNAPPDDDHSLNFAEMVRLAARLGGQGHPNPSHVLHPSDYGGEVPAPNHLTHIATNVMARLIRDDILPTLIKLQIDSFASREGQWSNDGIFEYPEIADALTNLHHVNVSVEESGDFPHATEGDDRGYGVYNEIVNPIPTGQGPPRRFRLYTFRVRAITRNQTIRNDTALSSG